MSICFDDNSLIVNSDLSECSTFINNQHEAYINISNCIYKYNNNNLYLSNELILNNNINYHNSNIIPYINNSNNIGVWNKIYSSNIYTSNLAIINPFYLELILSGLNVPQTQKKVPFYPVNNIITPYWNNINYNFIPPVKGIYAINYSWASGARNSISKIIINDNNNYCISNQSNGSSELIHLFNTNDKLSFWFDGDEKIESYYNTSQCFTKASISLIRHIQ